VRQCTVTLVLRGRFYRFRWAGRKRTINLAVTRQCYRFRWSLAQGMDVSRAGTTRSKERRKNAKLEKRGEMFYNTKPGISG